jgi:hypothetical protein
MNTAVQKNAPPTTAFSLFFLVAVFVLVVLCCVARAVVREWQRGE